ncbi:MAG: signal recognition particle protein [Acidobacteria bacterium]|nr:signal recognition particle protein [Acidobacteriota bacterium]MDA1235254.1 signal recognition particle protein [Acidobacteriota bacterium]
MFENLSEKLQRVFKDLRGEGKLTEGNIQDALREIRLALLEADVNFKVVKELILNVRTKALGQEVLTSFSPTEQVVKIVKDELIRILGSGESKLRFASQPPSIFMIVGLQGSGKTTSTGKIARWLIKNGKRPLLVSVDVYRPAAREQLRVLAKQVDVPIYAGEDGQSPLELAKGARREANQTGRDVVLIDTAGRLHIDDELMVELEQLKSEFEPVEVLFVADAMTGQDAVNSAAEFNTRLGITGVVLTKMDGDARGGGALSIRQVTGRPLKFIGVGEKADALELFHPDRIVSRILGMGDVLSLIEKVEEQIDKKDALEMQDKLLHNEFTLEDFQKQLRQLKKMGSLQSLLSMLPSVGPFKDLQNVDMDPKELVRIEAIISSMTTKERKNHEIINGSRRRRIARGSGVEVQAVNALLKQYREARRMMRSLTGGMAGVGAKRKGKGKKKGKGRGRGNTPGGLPQLPPGMNFPQIFGR